MGVVKAVWLGASICASFVSGLQWHEVTEKSLNRHLPRYNAVSFEGLHEQISVHERQRRDLGYGNEQPIRFDLNVFGRTLEVEARKTGVQTFGESYSMGPDSSDIIDTSAIPVITGHVLGVANSKVDGRIFDGIFEGMIHTPEETYHVEKATKFLKKPEFHAVAYKWSDIEYETPEGTRMCGSDVHDMLTNMHENLHIEPLKNSHGTSADVRRRQSLITPTSNTCLVKMVADYMFYAHTGGSAQSIAVMANVLKQVNNIYESTPFYSSTSGVKIQLASNGYLVWNTFSNPVFTTRKLVNETLLAFSSVDWDEACLAHLFTYRDYNNGTLGMAWVAEKDKSGGICAKKVPTRHGLKSLNTGVSTALNFGSVVPEVVLMLTVAHEMGHNFGSQHDTPSCSPGGQDGDYVMAKNTGKGSLPNNKKFSECSVEAMVEVMDAKASCFVPYPEAFCGDGIKDNEEECDCGGASTGMANPECTCCTEDCKLIKQCDPRHDDCCTDTCEFAPAGDVCSDVGECTEAAYCTGDGPKCPASAFKPVNTKCGNNAFLCSGNGVCSQLIESSVCNLYDTVVCELEDKECVVSCISKEGVCQSLVDEEGEDVAGEVKPVLHPGGYPCFSKSGGYHGQCNELGECEDTTQEDALDMMDQLTLDLYSVSDHVSDNWFTYTVGALVAVIVTFSLCLCCLCVCGVYVLYILTRPVDVDRGYRRSLQEIR